MFGFAIVAMVTKQSLGLVENGNKCNSNTLYRIVTIFGVQVHMDNTHETMKPDFLIGCHGNREPTNQDILQPNSNLKIDIKIQAS